jgi:hypothetical protein
MDNRYDWFSNYYVYALAILQIVNAILVVSHAIFGKVWVEPFYLKRFNILLQIVICIVLILKFNPFRTHVFKSHDARLITGSAIFLLFNLGMAEYSTTIMNSVKKTVEDTVSEIAETL